MIRKDNLKQFSIFEKCALNEPNQLVFYRHMKVQKSLRPTAMRKGISHTSKAKRQTNERNMREKLMKVGKLVDTRGRRSPVYLLATSLL